jgi:hypothetical protein
MANAYNMAFGSSATAACAGFAAEITNTNTA